MAKLPNLWVYKCNSKEHNEQIAHGDWEYFIENQPTDWGGSTTIHSNNSLKLLGKMAEGDLVLCWQSNRKAALALAEVLNFEEWMDEDGTEQREMVLGLVGEPFSPPVKLLELRKRNAALAAVRAFQQGFAGTLYETSADEAMVLLRACGLTPPDVCRLRATAASPVSLGSEGAGFGDAEHNRKVEKAAVRAFTKHYAAWTIESVEAEKCGYDFVCTKGRQRRHVELKGVSGPHPTVILTRNETHTATHDELWRLVVVTDATTKSPTIHEWSAADFRKSFDLRAISYRATLKA